MTPVYLAGRALISALGADLAQALQRLCRGEPPNCRTYTLGEHGSRPYLSIATPAQSWDERARTLVIRALADAGASTLGHQGAALFIATSCQDGQAAEECREMDFHALSKRIAGWLDWRGPVFLYSNACTSSLVALQGAREWLLAGRGSDAVVLGLELDNLLTLPGFAALQLLSPTASLPLGAGRDGLLLGEAVSALHLSTRQPARWQLLGGANVVDGRVPTAASADAVAKMCQRALEASGMQAGQIDLFKVQAAGSPGNDAAEAEGLRSAFAKMPALISLKPLIGHCMGASGVAEIALLLECLEQQWWPQFSHPVDPELGVQLAPAAPPEVRTLMASILGFGGSHAAVVIGQGQP